MLDYGCGAGSFAHQLDELGGHVTGIDPSLAMIAKPTAAYGDGVTFLVGDSRLLRGLPPFVLITSIMALQFVADLPTLFADLTQALVPGGHLIFAVHNPAFFQGEVLRFANGVEAPIFIRSAVDYHAVAEPAGVEPLLLETYPRSHPSSSGAIPRMPAEPRRNTSSSAIDAEVLANGWWITEQRPRANRNALRP
jgi:SAM-dependent methyltransferase